MNQRVIALIVTVFVVAAPGLFAEPDRFLVRTDAWQRILDHSQFSFPESEANASYSLAQLEGDFRIRAIHGRSPFDSIKFEIVRNDKELFTIRGHAQCVFRVEKGVLYFAKPSMGSCGCSVEAHDLVTEKNLWTTNLKAVGQVAHSVYWNEVTMDLVKGSGPDANDEGIVRITGRESFGDYIEILDQKTGRILAHKIYREGFGR